MNELSIRDLLNLYNPADTLERASTIPAPWYFDTRIAHLERENVFAANSLHDNLGARAPTWY